MSGRSSLDRAVAAAFPLLVGGLLLRLVVSGRYRDFVKASMWPWLTLSGFALLTAAAWELASARAPAHGHRPRVAWLLLAPVVVVLGIAPRSLGSAALARATRSRATYVYADGSWAKLPADGVPLAMTIGEFVERTYAGATTRGVPVKLTGFVVPDDDGSGTFRVVRFRISCCAADAAPVAVRVVDPPADRPKADSWVTITGTLVPDDPAALDPRFEVTALEAIDEPSSPYESLVVP